MACDPIYSAFIRMTGHLSDNIHRRVALKRPIVGLQMQNRGVWPDGVGNTFSNVTYARNFPLDIFGAGGRASYAASTGTQTVNATTGLVTLDEGDPDVDACLPNKLVIPTGSFTQAVTKNKLAIETPDFCYEDIRAGHEFARMWANVSKQLEDVTAHVWAEWFTNDYHELSGTAVTALVSPGGLTYNDGWDEGDTINGVNNYAFTLPTSKLTMGMVEEIEHNIMLEGPDGMMDSDGAYFDIPVFWIVSLATYQRLLRDNAELRQDIRWAYMGARDESPLLPRHSYKRMIKTLGGHNFVIDPFPRRFSTGGGAASHVRVPHWESSAATIGTQMKIRAAYKTAAFEESIAWVPGMYRSLAISKAQSLPDFKPTSWSGDFKAKNIEDKECNPDGNKVFWRALFADGAEPLHSELGYTILHLNCGFNSLGAAC